MKRLLGLDIGGANLKMAHTDGFARTVPFELWKQPLRLPAALGQMVSSTTAFDEVAVTMTGELCDCFETKAKGVESILDALEITFPRLPVWVWRNDARFVDMATARQTPYQVASANWLALATFAGRLASSGAALLIDIGSTTTDIIPLMNGQPVPLGRTDADRLQSGELVYRGVRRTPVPWTLHSGLAAEVFATSVDALLLTNKVPEDGEDRGTADGRPAVKRYAHARLARMLGGDAETCSPAATLKLARLTVDSLIADITAGIHLVAGRLTSAPCMIVTAGSGAFLIPDALKSFDWGTKTAIVSLEQRLGTALSSAACAHAVAVLASERSHGH